MIPDQRRQALLRALRESGVLSIRELCDLLKVSHMTIRRDIATLEAEGLVEAVAGGVRSVQSLRSEPTYQDKSSTKIAAKTVMAERAAEFVQSGQTLFLDAGTSLGHLVPHLAGLEDLTVVTNDLTTAVHLSDLENIVLFQIGGHIDRRNRSTVGAFAAEMLAHFNFDLALISTSSWDLAHGVSTPSELKVGVKRAAIAQAKTTMLVAGSEKYGLVGTFGVAPLNAFDHVLTDPDLPESEIERIHRAEIDLILSEPA